jgi:serine protease Do
MVHAMRTSVIRSRSLVALAALFAPALASRAAAQQQDRPRRPAACAGQWCADDSTRTALMHMLQQLDSLQSVYFGRPVSAEQRQRMSEQISTLVNSIAEMQQQAVGLALERSAEAQREAMTVMGQRMDEARTAMRAAVAAMPKGWIGLNFVAPPIDIVRNGEHLIRYLDYPEILSVEPDSPAQRAGIAEGDLLLAFNGSDVTAREISMTKLLQPDRKVVIRVRRDGADRDFPVVVARAPQVFVRRREDLALPPEPPLAPAVQPRVGVRVMAPSVTVRTPSPPNARALPAPDPAAAPPAPGVVFTFDSDLAPIAGARMTTLNPDLGSALGVKEGVLVISAAQGTVAQASGLRGGDVIVKAGGTPVSTVRDLRRVLERSGASQAVELQVLRDHRTRTVTLRW